MTDQISVNNIIHKCIILDSFMKRKASDTLSDND